MAFGLYKPGQGYWVRVMAAALTGMIILAASGWVWAQIGAIDLPYGSWRLGLTGVSPGAAPPPGTALELLGEGGATVGTAELASLEPTAGTGAQVTIRSVKMTAVADPSVARSVRAGEGFSGTVSGLAQGVPVVERIYLQAGAVSVLIIAGAVLAYWLIGARPRTAEFLIATDGEMKKVNWSSWKDIRGSTLVVTFASFLIAAGLFGVDFVFSAFFRLIGVLER